MIDFLNLKQSNSSCECLKLGHSMQLLPNQVDPYVLYFGYPFYYLESIYIINIYGERIVLYEDYSGDTREYVSLAGFTYDDLNSVILEFNLIPLLRPSENLTLYSDHLKISSYKPCKTTRVNFRCNDTDIMQSIQFPFYYVQDKRNTELESAYQISTKNTMTYATSNSRYSVYKSQFMSIDAINKLNDALISPFVYFNKKRMNLFEAIEIPDVQADERFGETTILMSKYIGINDEDLTDEIFVLGSRSEDDIIQDGNKNIIATDGY